MNRILRQVKRIFQEVPGSRSECREELESIVTAMSSLPRKSEIFTAHIEILMDEEVQEVSKK